VLVVDDEAPIRTLVQRTLIQRGSRVLLAAHGAEAVALYAQHRNEVAAVLTEIHMPGMDGGALVIALRSTNPSVRVIGSSGLDPTGELAKLTDFVSKPYTTEALLGSLQRALAA
jgi:CheY-like chemotaxis protein